MQLPLSELTSLGFGFLTFKTEMGQMFGLGLRCLCPTSECPTKFDS